MKIFPGVYMVFETGEIFLWIAAGPNSRFGLIVVDDANGVYSVKVTRRLVNIFKRCCFIGSYL